MYFTSIMWTYFTQILVLPWAKFGISEDITKCNNLNKCRWMKSFLQSGFPFYLFIVTIWFFRKLNCEKQIRLHFFCLSFYSANYRKALWFCKCHGKGGKAYLFKISCGFLFFVHFRGGCKRTGNCAVEIFFLRNPIKFCINCTPSLSFAAL